LGRVISLGIKSFGKSLINTAMSEHSATLPQLFQGVVVDDRVDLDAAQLWKPKVVVVGEFKP